MQLPAKKKCKFQEKTTEKLRAKGQAALDAYADFLESVRF